MKPIKSIEEFKEILERAKKRHEEANLKRISLIIFEEEAERR